MKIRSYSPNNFDCVTRFWRDAREQAFPEFQRIKRHTFEEDCWYFENMILKENNVYVAEVDRHIVGFMTIKDDFIDQLYVAPPEQRQGVGKTLLNYARKLSLNRPWLYTFQINKNGRTFYEKNGFIAKKFDTSPAPESEPDVLYEWKKT